MATVPVVAEKVKESLKETLLGTEETENVSTESKNRFLEYATLEEDGEKFMTPDDFINAIAPPEEDYVSTDYNALWTNH